MISIVRRADAGPAFVSAEGVEQRSTAPDIRVADLIGFLGQARYHSLRNAAEAKRRRTGVRQSIQLLASIEDTQLWTSLIRLRS